MDVQGWEAGLFPADLGKIFVKIVAGTVPHNVKIFIAQRTSRRQVVERCQLVRPVLC